MFTVMSIMFLINVSLCGMGVQLLEHPTDTMVIVLACSAVYIV